MNIWNAIVDFFQSNPIVGMITTLVTLFSLVYAIHTRRKDKAHVELSIYCEAQNVFADTKHGLEGYDLLQKSTREPVKFLNEAIFQMANTGNRRVEKSDINEKNPIGFEIYPNEQNDEVQIIDYKLVNKEIKKNRDVKLIQDGKRLFIDFSYLQPNEEIIVYYRFSGDTPGIGFCGEMKNGEIKRSKKVIRHNNEKDYGNRYFSSIIEYDSIERLYKTDVIKSVIIAAIMGFLVMLLIYTFAFHDLFTIGFIGSNFFIVTFILAYVSYHVYRQKQIMNVPRKYF